MSRELTLWLLLTVGLSACAHHGAMRVDCEGPLRPVNLPSHEAAPVSVVPATGDHSASGAPQS